MLPRPKGHWRLGARAMRKIQCVCPCPRHLRVCVVTSVAAWSTMHSITRQYFVLSKLELSDHVRTRRTGFPFECYDATTSYDSHIGADIVTAH